jgi:outer membrane protein
MIKKILLLLLLAAPLSLAAQKFAHFDYTSIIQSLPETKKAMSELEAMGKQYTEELQSMESEIRNKIEKYQSEVKESTPENIRTRREQEIEDLQQRYQQANEDNQKSFDEARTTKMQPIMQKVMDAVNTVAKEGNYLYIIDKTASQSAGIIINEALSEDVTKKVMDKLGLKSLDTK